MKKFKITEKGINLLLIFILGFLVGVALKSEAQKRITIGYYDYLVPKYKQDVNLMAPTAPVQPQPEVQGQNPSADENAGQPDQQNPQPVPDSGQDQPQQ
ncbi:MAG TPA: hypothetical protein VK254_03450 [Candidatus Bathyarchaeia archaeon]|nr:hypothetical protein [Candidatus Bathyarchaeia archaeon]